MCRRTDTGDQCLEKLTAQNQGRTATNNGTKDQLCHWAWYTKSQISLAKAATVTSQAQAGKSRFGSWQRKFSRSLALTSCCHGAEKLHEQPHTKPLAALPKGKHVSPRRTVHVRASNVQIQTVFLDFP